MLELGNRVEDSTIDFKWSSNSSAGASITRSTNGTISVYKGSGTTQSTAGVTDTEDFDALTGIHHVTIDTAADAFYAVDNDYDVVLSAATIDGQTVNAVLAHFRIERGFNEVDVTKWLGTAAATPTVAGVPEVDVTHFGGSAGTFASGIPSVNAAQISADATAADNLETMLDGTGGQALSLGRLAISRADATIALQVTNSGGAAVKFESTGGNGNGLWIQGHGTNEGLQVDGGDTGHGAIFTGGAGGSGNGVRIQGGASGDGAFIQGGATTGRGMTVQAQAGTTQHGAYFGGFGGGSGANFIGGATNANGITATGVGTGHGLSVVAGPTGNGFRVTGGSTSGDAINATVTSGSTLNAALLAAFFTTNSATTYASAVAGSVVKEIADNASGSGGPTAAAIADAVWDEDATAHQTQGSFGQVVGDSVSDSDSIWALVNTNLNATVSSRASQTTADAIETDTQDIQSRLPVALVSGRMASDAVAISGSTVAADAVEANIGNLDATVSSRLATAGYTAPLDAAGTRAAVGLASANLDTQLDAIPTAAEINAEVVDCLATDTYAELGSVPAATSSLAAKLRWLFMLARNVITQTATTQTLRNDADSGDVATSTHSDNGTTHSRGEWT